MLAEAANRICSPELLAQIAEVIDSPVLITRYGQLGKFDHRIIYANPAFSKLTGFAQGEILGRSPDILCDMRSSSDNMLGFYNNCTNSTRFSFELNSFKKQGSELKLQADVTPVIDETQGIQYFILTLKNHVAQAAVSEPEKAYEAQTQAQSRPEPVEASYRAAEQQYRPAGYEDYVKQNEIQQNKFDERFWQSPNNDVNPNSPENLEDVRNVVQSALHSKFNDEPNALPAELTTDESVAEYCKTQFLANMSHDLRTPLNAIIGFSEVIKDQLFGPIENPRYVSYANDIYRSGQELFGTIAEIMELSEIAPDEKVTDAEKMNICDVVESVIDVLSSKAFESDIKIVKTFDARDLRLNGDRRKIKQAVAGVIGNAIKYSTKGSKIEVSVSLNEKGDLKVAVYAKSANILGLHGKGLMGSVTKKAESEYPEISLAKRFIEAHDGKFAIFNSATSGTEISIILPSTRLSIEPEKKTLLKVIS